MGNKQTKRLASCPGLTEIVFHCAKNRDLVEQFDRLTRGNLSLQGGTIELMIDEVTGRQEDNIEKFINFVDDCIYQRLSPAVFEEVTA